ncbi:MAG: hypothetical protein N2445_01920, partial [Acidobacteria bacterium]|nr:hypothetical protein [Acidobacteriota bacterium]
MNKIKVVVTFFFFTINLFCANFNWTHKYQDNSSADLTTLANKLCGTTPVRVVQTDGFSIVMPAFSLQCGQGKLYYEVDEGNAIRGFYYEGNATISFSVEDRVEADRLEKCLNKRKLVSEPIKSFYILPFGICADLPKLNSESGENTQNNGMGLLKSGLRRDAIKFIHNIINPQNFGEKDLIILFELKNEIWAYQLNSTLENEVQFLRLSHPPYSDYDMWDAIVSLHLGSSGVLTPYISDYEYKAKIFCDVKKYEIDFDLNSNGVLNRGIVKATLFLNKPQNSLLFDFFPGFKVNRVLCGEKECQFIKEDFSKTYSYYDTSLLVKLPEKTEGEITIEFDIGGDLFDKAVGYIYLVDEDLWFPHIKDLDGFLFSFKAAVPEGFEALSVGDLKDSILSGVKQTFLWESSTQIRNATFTIGKFIHKKIELEEGVSLDVALPKDLRTNILSQAQEYTLNELKNVFLFFSKAFGKSPYNNIKVVITPYSYGRSFKWRGFSTEKIRRTSAEDGS